MSLTNLKEQHAATFFYVKSLKSDFFIKVNGKK